MENIVSIFRTEGSYPERPPYHPYRPYPEYPFGNGSVSEEPNFVYDGVRCLLRNMGLDLQNYGTSRWNPLGSVAKKGDQVLIKPNFVRNFHGLEGHSLFSMITHPSVVRAIIDYVYIALKGQGSIIIADAPQVDSDPIEITSRITGLDKVLAFYKKGSIPVKLIDLRVERALVKDKKGIIVKRIPLEGDPKGYARVRLDNVSEFCPIDNMAPKLRGSDYDAEETFSHHNNATHEYLISKTVLASDAFINVPKLKTHKRTGVTLNLKNIIGINGDKNWIPHFRIGSPTAGGDEYPKNGNLRRWEGEGRDWFLKMVFNLAGIRLYGARLVRNIHRFVIDKTGFAEIRCGSWHANDTLWRSILDLNKILFFADSDGTLKNEKQRNYLSIIDGIVAGENDGPVSPDPKYCKILIAGFDPVYVDICAVRLMGYDYKKIPKIHNSLKLNKYGFTGSDLDSIKVMSNVEEWRSLTVNTNSKYLNFRPPKGWQGQIEF